MGRPRLISSPEEFEERVDAFFAECEERDRPPTVTGMALAVGLSSRESLDEYGRRAEFSDAVKRAKTRVEAAYEGRLWGQAPAGAIFALKNMGWSDRTDHTIGGDPANPLRTVTRIEIVPMVNDDSADQPSA